MWVCKITQKAALAIIRISRTHCGEPAWTSARGQAQFLHIHYPYGSTFPWLKWPWSPDWKNPYIIHSFGQLTCCSLLVMQSFARILKWPSAGWGFQTLKIHEDICINPQMEQPQYAWDGLKPLITRQLYNGSLRHWIGVLSSLVLQHTVA